MNLSSLIIIWTKWNYRFPIELADVKTLSHGEHDQTAILIRAIQQFPVNRLWIFKIYSWLPHTYQYWHLREEKKASDTKNMARNVNFNSVDRFALGNFLASQKVVAAGEEHEEHEARLPPNVNFRFFSFLRYFWWPFLGGELGIGRHPARPHDICVPKRNCVEVNWQSRLALAKTWCLGLDQGQKLKPLQSGPN